MQFQRMFLAALAFAGVALTGRAQFEDPNFSNRTWLHVNGYTVHFDAPDANSNILGVGFSRYTGRYRTLRTAWEADIYNDSGNKISGYAGYSWSRAVGPVHLGVTGALMYHRNFLKQNSVGILPVGLPFVEAGGRAFRVRAYYIPPVRSNHDHQVALQALIRM